MITQTQQKKDNGIKTHVLLLAKTFPSSHTKKGIPTNFKENLKSGAKITTIRRNYPLWQKRIKEIKNGKANLSIREWEDNPYKSKQLNICTLTCDNSIDIERFDFCMAFPSLYVDNCIKKPIKIKKNGMIKNLSFREKSLLRKLAKNDGLSVKDFVEWFKDYFFTDTFKPSYSPLAIIHFNNYKYGLKLIN